MKRTNLAAYTPAEPTPPYLSINLEEDGFVSFMVRSKGNGSNTGQFASITIDATEALKLLCQAFNNLYKLNIDR